MNLHRVALCLGLLIFSLLSACQTPPKPAFRDIPLYPFAQRVGGLPDTEWHRKSTFRTSASREAVLNYYKETLPLQGWVFEGESFGNLGFSYPNADKRQPLIIRLRILTSHSEPTDFTIDQMIMGKDISVGISP